MILYRKNYTFTLITILIHHICKNKFLFLKILLNYIMNVISRYKILEILNFLNLSEQCLIFNKFFHAKLAIFKILFFKFSS